MAPSAAGPFAAIPRFPAQLRSLHVCYSIAVQASIAANTYVISGHAETKRLQDLLPGILNQVCLAPVHWRDTWPCEAPLRSEREDPAAGAVVRGQTLVIAIARARWRQRRNQAQFACIV